MERVATPNCPPGASVKIVEETPYRFRIELEPPMRVPGIVFATSGLLPDARADRSLEQVRNVATLPGIVEASYAMPDVHWGYGFPIGGVAGTDVDAGGVVSPGGVGFDISCGVRLLAAASLDRDRIARRLRQVMDGLDRSIPRGMGRGAVWRLRNQDELTEILLGGSRYAVKRGYGTQRDLDRCEDYGMVAGADPSQVSARSVERGLLQVGSLGSGNHFLEVQAVDAVYDESGAAAMGLHPDQVCVMIHCGSRGLGHQICTDHVRVMETAMPRYAVSVPDRQLACVPVTAPEGRAYLGAMAAAATYGRAWYSSCHGAGRRQSRHQAVKSARGKQLRADLEAAGIAVRGASWRGLAEETPQAYKDVSAVVEVAEKAGLCRRIARLVPLGVVKG